MPRNETSSPVVPARERNDSLRGLRQLPAGGRILFAARQEQDALLSQAAVAVGGRDRSRRAQGPTLRASLTTTEKTWEATVALQQNTTRIQTTHIGSLPRPHALLDIMKAKLNHQPYDPQEYKAKLTNAVADCVKKQVDCGIDLVTDGEFSKP